MGERVLLGCGLIVVAIAGLALIDILDLRRRMRRLARWLGEGGPAERLPLVAWAGSDPEISSLVERRRSERGPTPPMGRELALLIAEVSARLDTGSPVADAWRSSWERSRAAPDFTAINEDGVPEVLERLAVRPRWSGVRSPADVVEVLRSGSVQASARRRAVLAIAAACRFTFVLGAPLARVLDVIADGVDESEAAEDARRIAGAGPRTSARVLTAMPMIGVVVAAVMGADPIGRFADGGLGTACFVVGATCLAAGHAVSRRMLARLRAADEAVDPAILADLAVAGLESGASIPAVCEALGVAIGDEELGRIGRELGLGVSWARAWDEAPANTTVISSSLQAAWEDGTSPVPMLRRAAAQLRSRRVADARARAEELGVKLVAPLGALLLPAFLTLGLGPILIQLARDGFAGLG